MSEALSQRGVRIGNESLTFVGARERIRPLRDQIIVEPLPPNPLLELPWKPIRGVVLAVGPGVHPKRYDRPKGSRRRSWDSKAFRPCDVRVGDTVELGGKEIGGYLHTTIRWGAREVLLVREEDVAVVLE